MIDYDGPAQGAGREARQRGELMGIGICSFTEIVGAGPSHDFDILGLKMFDSCEIRVHPTGKVLARIGVQTQGQGHETTFAQIIAEELGFPVADIKIEYGDTDTAPYGLGTYALALDAGRRRGHGDGVAQDPGQGRARSPRTCSRRPRTTSSGRTASSASRARPTGSRRSRRSPSRPTPTIPAGMEAGLEAVDYYDPPNLTFPFGSYICVVDIDKGTGQVKIRRFVAVDDCGNIINPMIVDGQIHGGLTMGLAPALYEEITYDELGNNLAGTFMDYLLPTAVETPAWETGQDRSPRRRTIRSAPRASASRRRSAPRRRSPTRSSTRCGTSASATSTSRSRRQKVWAILHEKGISLGRVRPDRSDVFARAAELEAAGRPFALATVVAVQRPTSARPGRGGDRPSRRHDRGLGRRQLRPAGRRPRGAPRARRRPAAPAPAVEGRRRPRAAAATASSSWS